MKFDRTVSTTCPYCGVGCQIDLNVKDGKILSAKATEDKAPNYGRLCVKGRFGTDYTHHPSRLTRPLIRKDLDRGHRKPCGIDGFREASWEEALELAAERISRTLKTSGGSAFGTFCCAKATNEDNYLFQKFVRAVLKTNNIDHCARLCHAASVAGLQKALGSAAMSNSIAEMKDLDLFIVTGSNTTETHPVISTYMKEAVVKKGARLIVIDPRKIELSSFAILHLQHKPGTDVAVYQAMAHVIVSNKLYDKAFIDSRTEGFADYTLSLGGCTPQWAEKISGVPAEKIEEAARLYAQAEKAAFYWGMGISQSVHGTDNTLSIANLALMCGHLGKPGTGVNPLRGQNNVQGCSDSGGLPNIYPGYQSVADENSALKLEKAWGTELNRKPGLTTLEMSDAIGEGVISDFIIMGENPLMSEPDLNKARKHLSELKNMIVIDIFLNETGEYGDVILPAAAFSEKSGTFTNSDRRVQLVRKALDPPGEAREDWQIIGELARRVGEIIGEDFSAQFSFDSPSQIWDEMAALVPAFGGISHERIQREDGVNWPCPEPSHKGSPYLFSESFPRGKGKFHKLELSNLSEEPDTDYPFILSTGRVLYHWHGGTMTRRSVLNDISPHPFVEIHPNDARAAKLNDESRVRVSSRRGQIDLPVRISNRSPEGVLFIPIHFAEAAVNELTNDLRDRSAKIPDYKICAVTMEKIP